MKSLFKGVVVTHLQFGKGIIVGVDEYFVYVQFEKEHPKLPPHRIVISDFLGPKPNFTTDNNEFTEYITEQHKHYKHYQCPVCGKLDVDAIKNNNRFCKKCQKKYTICSDCGKVIRIARVIRVIKNIYDDVNDPDNLAEYEEMVCKGCLRKYEKCAICNRLFAKDIMVQSPHICEGASVCPHCADDFHKCECFGRNIANVISSYNQMHPTDLKFNPANNILYLYKANCIKCKQRHSDHIISATAMIMAKCDERVPINVEYCTKCQRFFLSYSLFEMYRRKYTFLIVKLQMVTENGEFPTSFGGGLYRADISPLRLAGYSVSSTEDLSFTERHQLLAKIIQEGILPKYKVIDYLQYFISMNEGRYQMRFAVQKWKADLLFVLNYRLNEQPAQEIDYYSSF